MKNILKVILIDDEAKAIKSLEWELKKFCEDIEIIGTFTDPHEALDFLKNNRADCIFLDIGMPRVDGFQFLSYFKERDFEVVFVTAYNQYGIQAVKENAVDYLLKPIDADDLISTVEKIKARVESKHDKDLFEESLLAISDRRISIPIDGKIVFLQPDEIIYCESDGNYCKIHLEERKDLFVTKKLKEVCELLPNDRFFRVHNCFVVNLKKVREYLKTDGYIVLNNKKKIPVSRNKKSSFLDKV